MSAILIIDESIEQETRKKLREHFKRAYGEGVDRHVDALLSLESHMGRFRYFQNKIGVASFSPEKSILISGFSVGSEMITAKHLGFGEIHGVEVSRFYYETCKTRLAHISGMYPQLYDGLTLPFENNRFNVVASSHVIEHTQSPEVYINECLRVLAPEGFLLIEFPHRYHPIELHTGVISFEWLPRIIRNLVLSLLSGSFSPLQNKKKKLYKQILTTNLQQISMGRIKRALRNLTFPSSIVDTVEWKPGIIRCIIKKAPHEKTTSAKLIKGKVRELRSKVKPDTFDRRKSILINNIEVGKSKGLEIGPLDKPLVTKNEGAIQYVDYMSRDDLIARHADTSKPENIVEVDYVISPRKFLSDFIEEEFDYIIACHVIEHIPNMIGWLRDVHKILKDNGYLYLAVPDKRYTFDIARPVTPLSHFLSDFHQNVTTADFAHVFEHIYLKRNITAGDVWNNKVQDKINIERFTARDAYRRTMHELEPGKYPDVHCHVFTSQDFLSIINTLISLQLVPYTVHTFEDVERPFNEFIVILKKA